MTYLPNLSTLHLIYAQAALNLRLGRPHSNQLYSIASFASSNRYLMPLVKIEYRLINHKPVAIQELPPSASDTIRIRLQLHMPPLNPFQEETAKHHTKLPLKASVVGNTL